MRFDTGCACCRDDFYDYEEWLMDAVTIVGHPLVRHKLSLMRDKTCSTKSFRQLLNEIGTLLCYEITRDLPMEEITIETPLTQMQAPRLAGKKLVFAPILRAGTGFLDGMLAMVPSARVAHIGLYRNPETLQAVEYYFKAPQDVSERLVILMDPMLATGNSAVAAVNLLGRDASIASLRGSVHDCSGVPLIVTYHPAYLLRTLSDKAKAWEDLCFAVTTMQGLQTGQSAAT